MTNEKVTLVFVILIVFSLVLFFLDRGGALTNARAVLERVMTGPTLELGELVSKKEPQSPIALEELRLELEQVKKENEALRLLLGVGKASQAKHLLSRVLSTSRGFIIDKGEEDTVAIGNTVVFKRVFVGKVISISKNVSRVLLPFEKDSVIEVKASKTGALGLAKGQGKQVVLSEVILSETLVEGDTVETIGNVDDKGLGVRPGLLVGKIEKVRKSSDPLYQEASIVPSIEYKDLQHVVVLL